MGGVTGNCVRASDNPQKPAPLKEPGCLYYVPNKGMTFRILCSLVLHVRELWHESPRTDAQKDETELRNTWVNPAGDRKPAVNLVRRS